MAKQPPLFVNLGQGLSMMIGLPIIASWNTAGRPKNAKVGTLGFNFQTKSLEYWDGSDWYAANMN
jgi:hypothetical protein